MGVIESTHHGILIDENIAMLFLYFDGTPPPFTESEMKEFADNVEDWHVEVSSGKPTLEIDVFGCFDLPICTAIHPVSG